VTRQDAVGRTVLHLVNYCGGYRRPITHTQPVRDIRISVRVDGVPSRARLLRTGSEIPMELKDGRVVVTVPVVEEYEAVVLEP
jgi:hypothetical protein